MGMRHVIDTLKIWHGKYLDTQKNPQNHKNLSVRVSGRNARFVTLNKMWQQMIIERTQQGI